MSGSPRQLVKNISSLSIAEVATRIASAGLGVIVARYLGASAFGQLTFALALTSFFNLLSDFGLTSLGIREVAKDKHLTNILGSQILTIQLVTSGILVLILLGLVSVLPVDGFTKMLIIIFGLGMLPTAANVSYILQAHEDMHFIAVAKIVSQASYVFIGGFLIYLIHNVAAVAWAQLLSACLFAGLSWYFVVKHVSFRLARIAWVELRAVAITAIPFMLAGILGEIYHNLDSIMVQFLRGEQEVGYYGAGYRIVNLLLSISLIVFGAYFPRMSQAWRDNQADFQKYCGQLSTILGLLVIPISVGGVIFAGPIIDFVFGQSFLPAIPAFRWLILLPSLISLNIALANPLIAAGNQNENMYSVILGAITNLILNIILIPRLGIVGAAIATIGAETLVCIYLMVEFQRKLGFLPRLLNQFVRHPFVAALAMVAVLWPLRALPLIWVLAIGGLIYGLALTLMYRSAVVPMVKGLLSP